MYNARRAEGQKHYANYSFSKVSISKGDILNLIFFSKLVDLVQATSHSLSLQSEGSDSLGTNVKHAID